MSTPLLSAEEKQLKIKPLVKALGLRIIREHTGNESLSTILKREQAADKTRAEKIKELKDKIAKTPRKDKDEKARRSLLTSKQEREIGVISNKERKFTKEKNEAIQAHKEKSEIVPLLSLKEEIKKNKDDFESFGEKFSIPKSLLTAINGTVDNNQSSRNELFEKFQLSKLFSENELFKKLKLSELLKKIDEQGMVQLTSEEYGILGRFLKFQDETIQKIYLDEQDKDPAYSAAYNNMLEQQTLKKDLEFQRGQELANLNNMAIVMLEKDLENQEKLLKKYNLHKEKGGGTEASPASDRTVSIMEVNKPRRELNAMVVDKVRQKLKLNTKKKSPHISCAIQYCIGQLEQVNPAVEEALRKKCIKAGWVENEKKELIYGKGPELLLMSRINDLSYDAYVQVAEEKLGGGKEVTPANPVAEKREEPVAPAAPVVVVHPPIVPPPAKGSPTMLLEFIASTQQGKSVTLRTTEPAIAAIDPSTKPTVTKVDTPTVTPADPPTNVPSAKLEPEFKLFCDAVVKNYKERTAQEVTVTEAENKMQITPPPWEIRKITPRKSEITIPDDDATAAEHIIRSAIQAALATGRPVHINLQDPKQIEFAIAETNKMRVKHVLTLNSQEILAEARAKASTKDAETPARKSSHPS